MISMGTILKVADNSGAKTVKCIKILDGFKKKYASLGDSIISSVQQLRNKSKMSSKVIKGDIFKALVIKVKKPYRKKDGSLFLMQDNAVILISKEGNPLSSRILEPIPKVLKKKMFIKLISLSSGLV